MYLNPVLTQVYKDKFTIFSGLDAGIWIFLLTLDKGRYGLKVEEQNQNIQKPFSQIIGTNVTLIQCGDNNTIDSSREQWSNVTNTLTISHGQGIFLSLTILLMNF